MRELGIDGEGMGRKMKTEEDLKEVIIAPVEAAMDANRATAQLLRDEIVFLKGHITELQTRLDRAIEGKLEYSFLEDVLKNYEDLTTTVKDLEKYFKTMYQDRSDSTNFIERARKEQRPATKILVAAYDKACLDIENLKNKKVMIYD